MTQKAIALTERFENAYADLIAAVEACSDADWQRVCTDEGWSVGVTAHHVASTAVPISSIVQAVATGAQAPAITPEMLDANNAKHAHEAAGCTREETLALLRSGSAEAAQVLRGLTDDQLARTASLPLTGGNPISAEQMVEGAMIGHPTGHL